MVLSRFLLMMLLAWVPAVAFTQQSLDNRDPVYGFDPLLYNGRVYSFYPPPATGGTQYLNSEFDKQGAITLRGVTFSNLIINYDIYNQLLILKYTNAVGSANLISISAAWLQKFRMGGCQFEAIAATDTIARIYQVIGEGTTRILYYRTRELLLDNQKTTGAHYFSDVRREMYVMTASHLYNFNSNRGFIGAFGPDKQDAIKKYMRKHAIKVKKADDITMTGLINFCSTLTP